MSIDERILKMQFDNQQFERGAQTSIKTLDELKKGLNLDGAAKSLTELDRVGKRFSLAGISDGVDSLNQKFSAFGIMGISVIQNLTNSALNFGKRLVSSLTIDPIKTGLGEYETKIGAIQTILTNTASKGVTLADVNDVLADLNTYADKTIYNFSEMTKNIGTFTAAGVGLKESAVAIKGIANLAAGSGSTSQQASTAMYQLSQALAAGSVKLQDWNSVVNAGMGGELFQNALKSTAKEMGIVVDASVPFRESLKDGWITSEVLTKTLAKFAEDESLVAAATQVKTFTQLFDTMKESVQSGWAVSWENIIGDKDQATALLTGISDAFNTVTGASAEARNVMLSFWKDNGGRAALIEAISNAFMGLGSVLEPIESAFREIFPAMDGPKLVEFTKTLRDLTAHFKMSDETADKVKRTFKGLFALLDMGRQAFVAISKGVGSLLNYLLPAGDGVLSFTANIGDFLVGLNESAKKTDIFNQAIAKIGDFFGPVAAGVKKAVGVIVEAMGVFTTIDTSGLDSFSERVKARFEPFTKLGEIVHSTFSKIAEVLKKVAPVFYKIAEVIGGAFGKLQDSIVNSLDDAEFSSIFDLINGGLFAAILLGVKNFISSLTNITDGAGGFFDGIKGILDGVKGSLEAWQSSLKAGTLLKIATAIGILAVSLVALSLIDSAKLTVALAAMTGMFVDLFGSMAIFQKIMGSEGFKGIGKVTTAMIGLSVAVLILSVAMTKLASLDWNGIAKGLTAVAVLSGILVASAKVLSTGSRGLIKGSVGFILFAAAITILTEAVEKLSKIDTADLAKGLIGVGVLAAELSLFMNSTNFKGFGAGKGLGFLGLAASILILSEAVKKLSDIDSGALTKGIVALGAVLTEIGLFLNLTGDSKRVIATATGLTILGAAMLIFASAIGKMGALSLETIGKGLLTMAGALAIVTATVNLLPKNMITVGVGLIAISGALVILSTALTTMGGMTWEGIAKGLVTLAGALTIISLAMMAMQGALPGAAALLIIAGALAIIAPVLQTLGSMSLSEIGKGLLALVGVFAVLGVSGLLLTPLVPVLLGLAGAVALLGVGCLAIGAGLLAFSAGLSALAISGTAGAAALVLVVTSIVGLIPFIAKTLAQGIIDFVRIIGEGMPVITDALKKMIVSIVDMLVQVTPVVVEGLFKMLMVILDTLVEYIPKITDAGMKIILGFLKGISDNIQDVVETAIDIVINFIKGVASKLPDIIQAGIDLIISFINGLEEGIRKNNKLIVDAVINLIDAMVDAFTENVIRFTEVGKNIVSGLVNGLKEGITSVVTGAKELATSALTAVRTALGIHSPSRLFKEIGANLGNALGLGIDENKKEAVDASTEMGNDVTKAAGDAGVKATAETSKAAKEAFDKAVEWIDERKYYNKLSLDEELQAWKDIQVKYAKGTEERKKADREVYRVKNELRKKDYDDEVAKLNNLKYYDKLTLAEELDNWIKIQKKYKKSSPEWAEANKEIYRLQKELNTQILALEEDFHAKSQEIIDKSIQDINDLTAAYEQAVEDRTKSLYSAYGLFDKVDINEPISGYELTNNLQSQVTAFELWSKNISELAQKGIGDGLLKELEGMGPDALSQIQALNNMSKPQLDNYVQLWARKYMDARTKATSELEGLNADTQTKIEELRNQTQIDLNAVNATWQTKLAELAGTSKQQLGDLAFTFGTSVEAITEDTKTKFTGMADAIKGIDWNGVGVNIIDGMKAGILSEAKSLADTTASVALQALKAAKKALGIHSPSKEFEEVGMYSSKGFAGGMSKYAGEVISSAESIGLGAVAAIKDAVSSISNLLSNGVNSSPSIRPVIDLSSVEDGMSVIDGMFSANKGINVSGIVKKLPKIGSPESVTNMSSNASVDKTPSSISFTQNNYSPKALSRVDIYRQTNNQISTLKGLVKPV